MAISTDMQWWMRAGGSATNSGGFDETVSGAGTNYANQNNPQLTLTDLACTAGGTAVSSATGGFTSAMIGNTIYMDASVTGTNFIDGYFVITGHTDTNNITVDRTMSNGSAASGGTCQIGGAKVLFENFASTASSGATLPAVATPLAGGHIVNIRGTDAAEPTTVEYDTTGYCTFPAGSATDGPIIWRGFGDSGERPLIAYGGLHIFGSHMHWLENLALERASSGFGAFGFASVGSSVSYNCIFDQNGFTGQMVAGSALNCTFKNTGTPVTHANFALNMEGFANVCKYCLFDNISGGGIYADNAAMPVILDNIFDTPFDTAIEIDSQINVAYHSTVIGNTIYAAGDDGIRIELVARGFHIEENLIVDCDNGINFTINAANENDKHMSSRIKYNAVYNSTTADYVNITKPADDLTLTADPFTDAANGDFSLNSTSGGGPVLKGVARKIGAL